MISGLSWSLKWDQMVPIQVADHSLASHVGMEKE